MLSINGFICVHIFHGLMKAILDNNLLFIRLFPNETLIDCLIDICKEKDIQTAVVISAIGQLKDITLGYFKEKGNYCQESFKKTYELIHMSGNIILHHDTYIPHLHVMIGDEQKKVIGGHLFKAIVQVTNEIVLLRSTAPLKREMSELTGLNELIIPPQT